MFVTKRTCGFFFFKVVFPKAAIFHYFLLANPTTDCSLSALYNEKKIWKHIWVIPLLKERYCVVEGVQYLSGLISKMNITVLSMNTADLLWIAGKSVSKLWEAMLEGVWHSVYNSETVEYLARLPHSIWPGENYLHGSLDGMPYWERVVYATKREGERGLWRIPLRH